MPYRNISGNIFSVERLFVVLARIIVSSSSCHRLSNRKIWVESINWPYGYAVKTRKRYVWTTLERAITFNVYQLMDYKTPNCVQTRISLHFYTQLLVY